MHPGEAIAPMTLPGRDTLAVEGESLLFQGEGMRTGPEKRAG